MFAELSEFVDPEFFEVGLQGVDELGRQLTSCDPVGYLWVFTL